ncbi:unnamed protein product [Cylindrotheca closterium]|uniref:ADP-ribosyl cyclase/cyclic ADP-ribose hydrolase n=1 Tax=Cylindrotheca closterium TaxID=2856 RepID=A0AAD2JK67_9STRA|nr:unnamed protein product [Cylindrotheca closterium]
MKLLSTSLFFAYVAPSVYSQTNSTNQTLTNTTNTTEPEVCPCRFEGNDDDDCIVYGSLDGDLKAWPKADQACLDAYQIKVDAPDPSSTCLNANSFVLALRLGDLSSSQAKFGLGTPYGGFFEESPMNAMLPVLKESITIAGTTYDCEASSSNCYNAMKPYFESNAMGMQEMEDVCDTLQGTVFVARETEQSVLRTRLCTEYREPATIVSACSDIFDALEPELVKFSTKTCGGFGTGPGSRTLPGCSASTDAATSLGSGYNLFLVLASSIVGLLVLV